MAMMFVSKKTSLSPHSRVDDSWESQLWLTVRAIALRPACILPNHNNLEEILNPKVGGIPTSYEHETLQSIGCLKSYHLSN